MLFKKHDPDKILSYTIKPVIWSGLVSNFYKYQKFEQHEPHIWYPGLDKDADSIRLDNNIKGLSTIGSSKFGLIKGLFKPLPKNIGSFDIIHQHGIWMPISLFSKKINILDAGCGTGGLLEYLKSNNYVNHCKKLRIK